jgi:hypothetical protein
MARLDWRLREEEQYVITARFPVINAELILPGTDSRVTRVKVRDGNDLCVRFYRDHISNEHLQNYSCLLQKAKGLLECLAFENVLTPKGEQQVRATASTLEVHEHCGVLYSVGDYVGGPSLEGFTDPVLTAGFPQVRRQGSRALEQLGEGLLISPLNTKARWNHKESQLTYIATDIAPEINRI